MNAPHHRLPRPVGFVPMYLRASLTSELLVAPPYAEFECVAPARRASARDRRLCRAVLHDGLAGGGRCH